MEEKYKGILKMMTKDIRKTIDNARDVLVGKIPNPQSQIEQITIAMIYKFMDDMDIESVEFGGERQFFIGELEEFAWSKLMSSQLGAEARMNLYTLALDKLPLTNSIPKLFRDIFKGAYLPFRDGQTLTLFLKEINEISYDNSENLGNAFEYLLSIMGSQGDAGQFRTPRHIIDFIVNIVKPTKIDKILDPACGTAGFLISAYKYIIKTAKKADKRLAPKELNALTNNFQGYDISPDMVKLALVNMYLHKFKEPKIYEYDTLTKLDRWDDYFDVILANPPFMTPKGGIQPHNRFGVKANRSEVLFVDYIMEHLNTVGRAGVIVPEGIVFQSANAYKELRKKLVDENYLYAVVSLPSGVFQPYSGVKTSILLMDKQLAKKTDKILFVEIQNDGFDLGAQRREIDKNDLPQAMEFINQLQNAINTHSEFTIESKMITLVEKTKIAENEEYNLTASRYKETKDYSNCKWDMVKLGDVCELKRGLTYSKKDETNDNNGVAVLRSNNIDLKTNTLILNDIKYISKNINVLDDKKLLQNDVFICLANGSKEHLGKVAYIDKNTNFYFGGFMGVIRSNLQLINSKYLFNCLASSKFNQYLRNNITGVNINNLNAKILYDYKIPLPPLEVQEEIVKELNGYQAIIDGAQKVIDNWHPTIPTNPNWQKVKLGEYISINNGDVATNFEDNGKFACIKVGDMNLPDNQIYITTSSHWTNIDKPNRIVKTNSVIFPKRGAAIATNKKRLNLIPCYIDNNCMAITLKNENYILPAFLFRFMQNFDLTTISNSAGIALINNNDINGVDIFIPSLEEQQKIVAEIEKEEQMVNSCKQLIELYKQKIDNKIKSIWEGGE